MASDSISANLLLLLAADDDDWLSISKRRSLVLDDVGLSDSLSSVTPKTELLLLLLVRLEERLDISLTWYSLGLDV